MEKTLLVLAAGLGSRFGGLKQMEGFGPSGETILEYSIYDALQAGFDRFVFVIRQAIESDFRDRILSRLPDDIQYELCFQELDKLPAGYHVPNNRVKPWGTGHAVWVARDLISGPFAIVNGDDFYGRNGFQQLSAFFDNPVGAEHAMVAYPLGRTLSDAGTVSRGICVLEANDELIEMREVTGIQSANNRIISESESPVALKHDTPASMNLFGFSDSVFKAIEEDFLKFLEDFGAELKSEFYIPSVVNRFLQNKTSKIKVLKSRDDWMGVTNPEDRVHVEQGIRDLVSKGAYPTALWS